MAVNQYYVDPAIAGNSGTGTIGDPFGDLQYALNTVTPRSSGLGDQFNIKAGTAEILAAVISLATYQAPTTTAPLIIKGYTSTANDGGVGEIDCNGGAGIPSAIVHLRDLYIHNGGSSTLVTQTSHCSIKRCKVANTSGTGILAATSVVSGNEIADCGTGVSAGGATYVYGNYFKPGGVRNFSNAINASSTGATILRNILSIGTSGTGILVTGTNNRLVNNSIFSSSSTGDGITTNNAANWSGAAILNNIIEGFSGTGGAGFAFGNATARPAEYSGNAVYNCTTAYENPGVIADIDDVDNETLGASPFAKSGSDTFANRFVYFAPVDTGNVYGGAIQ